MGWSHWQEHRGLLPLVAAATLAPSPHNAQAWLFRLAPYRVDLIADTSRGTGAIDPFQRELYVGLGAALENLVLAADAHGLVTTVALMPEGPQSAHAARIELRSTPARESELYRQIPRRHTDRHPYARGKELPPAALRAMQSLTTSETPDARLFCYASRAQRTRLGEPHRRGDRGDRRRPRPGPQRLRLVPPELGRDPAPPRRDHGRRGRPLRAHSRAREAAARPVPDATREAWLQATLTAAGAALADLRTVGGDVRATISRH